MCPVFAAGSMLCPFLEDHKEDILCGPVWLASGLDLSGHAGMLSLTSPKLVKGDGSRKLHLLSTLMPGTHRVVVLVGLQAWQEGSTAPSWFI